MTEHPRIAQWLASALDTPSKAWLGWERGGTAMPPTGRAFDAVRISAEIIHAVAQSGHPDVVRPCLDRLVDGPVIHDAYGVGVSYYVLVPVGARIEHTGTDAPVLAHGTYVGVPDVHRTARPGPYWLLPPRGVGDLCTPTGVGRLIRLGRQRIDDPASGPAGPDLEAIEQRCRTLLTGPADLAHDLSAATEATQRARGYLMVALPVLDDAAGRMPAEAPARSRVLLGITEAHRQLGQAREEAVPVRQYAHARRLAECCLAQLALLRELDVPTDVAASAPDCRYGPTASATGTRTA
ncbi:DUF6415 family natural product biosynthesis protein [Streptomyces sp. NPDC051597]|uniref:DUF6415 family natural product biosynthesis protein n=1 Tax=Streptomyces sp. NPDC051597 TaxID=3155049 RepID=UPI003449986A